MQVIIEELATQQMVSPGGQQAVQQQSQQNSKEEPIKRKSGKSSVQRRMYRYGCGGQWPHQICVGAEVALVEPKQTPKTGRRVDVRHFWKFH